MVDLEGKFYENDWEEKKLCHLKPRILKFFGEFEVITILTLMGGVKSRIGQIRKNDIREKTITNKLCRALNSLSKSLIFSI